jgi:subtilisin
VNHDRPAWSRESAFLALDRPVSTDPYSPQWAFGESTGRGVRVAVIDSGIDATHPQLVGAVDVERGVTFSVDGSGRLLRRAGPHEDVYGHGTACAGIIHALAPEATIISIRVLDEGLAGRAAAFHGGLAWAIDQGYEVINLSLGAGRRDWALAFHDLCDRAYFANCFVVTAANNLPRESFPSLFASVTSVAANHATDPLRFHFNPDPPTEFLARGMNVEVPWLQGTTIVTTGNSFAAPHIAAVAALIRSKHPELRPFQVKAALWAASANVRESLHKPATGRPAPARQTTTGPRRAGPTGGGERQELQDLMGGYEVGELLRRDPWGPVFSARGGGRSLLMRRLDPSLAADPAVRERFLAAVRLAAGLRHPHLVEVVELKEDGRGAVMVVARSEAELSTMLRQGPLPVPAAVAAVLSVLEGLAPAHAVGLYHGDLRPEAVLIDSGNRLVVSDIGLAAALTTDVRTSHAPNNPRSWRYLAPEQFDGAPVGPYTDVHAAGLILIESLSGHLPYPDVASLGALVAQRARQPPRSLAHLAPDVPASLAAVADRAVQADPALRPPTVVALANLLENAACGCLGPRWRETQPFKMVSPPAGART